MPRLYMISPAPVVMRGAGELKLDVKFVQGMLRHVAEWNGPVTCVLRRGATEIPFGATYKVADLTFEIQVISQEAPLDLNNLSAGDLIFASADMHETLALGKLDAIPADVKLVYSIENTLQTRLRILMLNTQVSFLRKLRSMIWLLRNEQSVRSALRSANGLQANGYPAFERYSRLSNNPMLYLDGRISSSLMATSKEMDARQLHVTSDSTLRLVHSGRLETIKGGQDLIPIAAALRKANIDFTLDIFGSGSLEGEIRECIERDGLERHVRLHGSVDFETELVPFMRKHADIFLSCHRQSDPSCTYLESLGCGIPIVGYDNTMWRIMAQKSKGGWAVKLGDRDQLAKKIIALSRDRAAISEAGKLGLAFAQQHAFETEWTKRMDHLSALAQMD